MLLLRARLQQGWGRLLAGTTAHFPFLLLGVCPGTSNALGTLTAPSRNGCAAERQVGQAGPAGWAMRLTPSCTGGLDCWVTVWGGASGESVPLFSVLKSKQKIQDHKQETARGFTFSREPCASCGAWEGMRLLIRHVGSGTSSERV